MEYRLQLVFLRQAKLGKTRLKFNGLSLDWGVASHSPPPHYPLPTAFLQERQGIVRIVENSSTQCH